MPRILIDGRDFQPAASPAAWGDLLTVLDRELDSQGLLVTDVRFDGIDEPAYRDDAVTARDLTGFAIVEVGSATPLDLVRRCLDDAGGSLPALAQAARDVGEQFRGFDISGANGALVELAEGVSTLMGIVGTAGGALQLDLRSLPCGTDTVGERVEELTQLVDRVLAAQHQQDWLTVADILEYDLAPFVESFGPVLAAFEPSAPAA